MSVYGPPPVGKEYGSLVVRGQDPSHRYKWLCRCKACKRVTGVRKYDLVNGRTSTCGCGRSCPSNQRLLTYKGRTMNMTRWAAAIGMTPNAISARLARGMSVELALSMPSLGRGVARKTKE